MTKQSFRVFGAAASMSLCVSACGTDSGSAGTGGSGGATTGGASSGGGGASAGSSSGGKGGTTAAGSGGSAGSAGTASGGGGGGGPLQGEPYVFVASTDGMLRAYTMSASDGSLTAAGSTDAGDLDFMTLGPDDRTLFVSKNQSVEAWAYDPAGESFTLLDSATTSGGGTHVAVDATGGFVLLAHYGEGALSFLSFAPGAGFGAEQLFQPGTNAHQVRFGSGGHVFVPCLGSNYVAQYLLDAGAGTLTAASPANVPAAGGPRHMDFHPDGSVAYLLAELSSQVHVLDVTSGGFLEARAGASVYTAQDEQAHWSSDIHVTPDGKFVYAVNRDPEQIVTFRVETDRSLTRLSAFSLSAVVRAFAIDPAGQFVQVGGEDGLLHGLRIDADSGALATSSSQGNLGNIHATEIRYLQP